MTSPVPAIPSSPPWLPPWPPADALATAFLLAVPVVAGYALGNFVPYAGILYKDYTMKDRYEFTKTYAGKDYTVRIDETFHARHKLYALAGVNYFLADNISLGVNGSFGKRQSVQLQFNISF